jgi:SAM-dependent methyltransferase
MHRCIHHLSKTCGNAIDGTSPATYLNSGPRQSILLDVGGADINDSYGRYREVLSNPPFGYCVADIAPGPGIDIVLGDPYRIPLAECSVDIVISGQAVEHIEFFWRTFQEIVRIVRSDGFIFPDPSIGRPDPPLLSLLAGRL